jgi:uncharacterized integral membrane protein
MAEQDTRNPLRRLGVRRLASVLLGILVLVFIAENGSKTDIRFVFGPKVSAPLWVALLLSAVVGALAGWLLEKRHRR